MLNFSLLMDDAVCETPQMFCVVSKGNQSFKWGPTNAS